MGKTDGMSYEHYVPKAKPDTQWPNNCVFHLVTNMDELREMFKDFVDGKTCIAFDLETSGLDPEDAFIVGVCISMDGINGYYIPINHYIDKYNLGKEGLDLIYDYLKRSARVFVYNVRFDFRMMEYYGYDKNNPSHVNSRDIIGYDMSMVKYYDVAVGVWLADSNIKMPSLKFSSEHFLGIKQQTFAEVSDGVENFYYVEPEKATFYAASDAICTFRLVPVTIKYYQEAKFSGKLDNNFLYPLMHYEAEKVGLDGSLLAPFERELRERVEELEKLIYKECNQVFKLNSPAQVAQAFQSLGIDTGEYTASGYMKTGIELLEDLPKEVKEAHPVIKYFIEYKSSFKFLSSYVKVLNKEYSERGYLRSSYKSNIVPTGRLASGKDAKNSFFSEINTQSIPKPHPAFYYMLDLGDRELFDRKENILMGYQTKPIQYREVDGKKVQISGEELYGDKYMGVIESTDPHLNARRAFVPYVEGVDEGTIDDYVWFSCDYSGQELRLTANLSKEPAWMEAFTSGGDIHKNTACKIWGEENYDKEKRKMAKGANFAVVYGATAHSFVGTGGMNLQEAEQFFNDYKSALPTLFAYQERIQKRYKKEGTVTTYFGRPRRVRFYFTHGQAGFGYRTILNTPIQGCAADILKLTMCKIWKPILNHPEHKRYVRFTNTVHDEINYSIRKDKLNEMGKLIQDTMDFELPEWPVPIITSASFGWAWGSQIEVEWDKEKGHFVPIIAYK